MVLHTAVWFSIEACTIYVLYAGFAGRSDRRAGIAAAVLAAESLIFVGNGCRCPLTSVAKRLGIERGSVTDLYLPRRLAHNLPAIHAPLICLAGFLHARPPRPVLARAADEVLDPSSVTAPAVRNAELAAAGGEIA
jgi:hypothetical protein